MSAEPQNLLDQWAWLLFDGLARAGVTHVVISPGSRSTPFVLGAHAHSGLRCHDVIDERSAGFFALGLAKATGTPPVLVCTSGTAGAHYLPAVIEAGRSHTPLLILTADRPFELQQCDAPQTIDQVKLFGEHARLYVELGLPDASAGALRWLERTGARAVMATRWPVPGAVHLNARARKPLEPPKLEGDLEQSFRASVRAVSAASRFEAFEPRLAPSPDGVQALARACLAARRGLIVCGPGPLAQSQARAEVAAFSRQTGFPLLCEAASQLRFCALDAPRCDAFDLLCRSERFRASHAPDLVVQLGAPPTSPGWEQLLASAPERFIVAPHGWNDPQSTASGLVVGELREVLAAVVERLSAARGKAEPTDWSERWQAANEGAWRAVNESLNAGALTEGAAVRAVVSAVPKGGVLAIGNSLPIREVDTFCPASAADCAVWSQRGASGIDGLVSGAAGAAFAGRPTTLLLGDISFLHDLGGLAVARSVAVPFPIVVLNNDGGRIFEQLPVAATPAGAEVLRHWTTPHGLSLGQAASVFELPWKRVSTLEELTNALTMAHGRDGCTVIEVAVPPGSATEGYRGLAARIEAL